MSQEPFMERTIVKISLKQNFSSLLYFHLVNICAGEIDF